MARNTDISDYAVIGWIREAEESLKIEHIPTDICLLCIKYYKEEEIFATIGEDMIKSDDGKTVTRAGIESNRYVSWESCNHGLIVIPSTEQVICRWDLAAKEVNAGGMRVGVVSKPIQHDYCDNVDGYHYLFWNAGLTFNNKGYTYPWSKCSKEYEKGDTISIILNLKEKYVQFMVNGKDADNRYTDIATRKDIKYRLYTSVYGKNDCVQILNFSRFLN